MSKTISILGCGWLGFAVAKHLIRCAWNVKGSTTSPAKMPILRQEGISPFLLNFSEEKTLTDSALADFFSSSYLLLNIPPSRKSANVAIDYPLLITKIVECVKKKGTKKMIFISSTSVYGNENRVVTEKDALHPERESGKALVQIEANLRRENALKTTILRFGGLVGGNRKAGRFLADKKEVKNGNAPINMIHQTDCVQIIAEILAQEVWNETLNAVASGHPTRREFYQAQAEKQGFEPPSFVEKEEELSYKMVSNTHLKKRLDYTFTFDEPMAF